MSLFGPNEVGPDPKPDSDVAVPLRLLVTVKAAPNPSEKYGETVCVAALSVDPLRRGWVRLYPVNHRELTSNDRFRKYEVISLMAKPARQDQRRESWKPIIDTISREAYLPPWERRCQFLDPYVEDSMCRLNWAARARADAQSLALVRPATVEGIRVAAHPGWTPSEQRKIEAYVSQLDLLDNRDRTPLQAPRFRAAYRYRCHESGCGGHEQGLLDWELVALQRKLAGYPDADLKRAIEDKFLHELCAATRDVAFTWETRPSGCTCSACSESTGHRRVSHPYSRRRQRDIPVAVSLIRLETEERHKFLLTRLGDRVQRLERRRLLQQLCVDRPGGGKRLRRAGEAGPVRLGVPQLASMLVGDSGVA